MTKAYQTPVGESLATVHAADSFLCVAVNILLVASIKCGIMWLSSPVLSCILFEIFRMATDFTLCI